MNTTLRVAVLGAGIMGSSTALFLARRGAAVTLFDAAAQPFSGASRWNEGKIHLGFLYSADRSLATVRQVLPGGLVFKPLVEELIGCPLDGATTPSDDTYLCHRESVITPDQMQAYFGQAARLVREHPHAARYLVDVRSCQATALTAAELNALSGSPDVLAGYRVPERSVATTWVADRFVGALNAEPRIEQCMAGTVTAVRPQTPGQTDGRWFVHTHDGSHGPYDAVVNALWEGRLAIDITAGLEPHGLWSNRYRLSLFLRTSVPVDLPCAVIATGPFGDIKNYNDRDFYLSWYPSGLVVDSWDTLPPVPPVLDGPQRDAICATILERIAGLLPATARLEACAESMALEGGWVFAVGRGSLADPDSTLHRRSDFGVTRSGSYLSVDTGKYSTAPWLARRIADSLLATRGS